ncbi:MAG: hypothetical protein JWP44_102 [Mucilaginibacter sp.]|nr:hypothetical protein [Mucilaginibacter sp.]
MKKVKLILLCGLAFYLCSSMSNCKEDKTPGPSTTVHGFVKEDKTGNPIANVQLQVTKEYAVFLSGNKYSDYDVVTTGADGSYSLIFTPLGTGTFYLKVSSSPPNYFSGGIEQIYPGKDNTANFTLTRVVNLSVHLKNNSNQNKTGFHIFISSCCGPSQNATWMSDNILPVIIDTTIRYKLPQLSSYVFQSLYFNGYIKSGPDVGYFADTISFKKSFYLSKNDTTLTVINP